MKKIFAVIFALISLGCFRANAQKTMEELFPASFENGLPVGWSISQDPSLPLMHPCMLHTQADIDYTRAHLDQDPWPADNLPRRIRRAVLARRRWRQLRTQLRRLRPARLLNPHALPSLSIAQSCVRWRIPHTTTTTTTTTANCLYQQMNEFPFRGNSYSSTYSSSITTIAVIVYA